MAQIIGEWQQVSTRTTTCTNITKIPNSNSLKFNRAKQPTLKADIRIQNGNKYLLMTWDKIRGSPYPSHVFRLETYAFYDDLVLTWCDDEIDGIQNEKIANTHRDNYKTRRFIVKNSSYLNKMLCDAF